jgi:hypothetical protein
MYALVLVVHSWTRWFVLAFTVGALVRGVTGRLARREWEPRDRFFTVGFVASMDLQLLFGLLLYFVLSPIVPKSGAEFKAAMKVSALRFFAVEHITMMLLALIAAHVTSVLCKKAPNSAARYRRLTWGAGLVLLLLLGGIPWPWMAAARPLFRWF